MNTITPQVRQTITQLCLAIQRRQVIRIRYNNKWRTVEPYLVGRHNDTDNPTLRAYYVDAPLEGQPPQRQHWRLFTIEKIEEVAQTTSTFRIRADYDPVDDNILQVDCRI
ncbi:WYL domain-containing protein [Nibrella viscosa]|uniref:WYL domain-containing protein n=1 Tax=Nibrella viscosa TaxID=1084524 RepID=UPI0031EDE23F